MRRWIMLATLLCLAGTAAAQDSRTAEKVDIDQIQTVLTQSRRSVFDHGMNLDAADKDAFWDLYSKFEAEKELLDGSRMSFLQTYVAKADQLTDEEALGLARAAAGVARAEIELRLKYTDEIAEALGGKVGARFYQIDAYITNVLTLEVLDNMHLIGSDD